MSNTLVNSVPTAPKAHIKVDGGLAVIYIDAASNQPLSVDGWDHVPVGGFPYAAPVAELKQRLMQDLRFDLNRYEVVLVEPPARKETLLTVTPEIEMEADNQWNAFLKNKNTPTNVPKSTQKPAPVPSNDADIIKAFSEIGAEDVEAVGSFLINLWPWLETELTAARLPKAPTERKRFKMGE